MRNQNSTSCGHPSRHLHFGWLLSGPVKNIFLGGGVALGLQPLGWFPVSLLCLAVLGWSESKIANETWRRAFLHGVALGLGYFTVALHWIGFAFFIEAGDAWMMPFAVGALAFGMALFWALGFAAARFISPNLMPGWVALSASLALAEIVRGVVLTGFPWASPGQIAPAMGNVVLLASVIGMQGLAFLILLWGLALGALARSFDGLSRKNWREAVLPLLLLCTLPLAWLWGQGRLEGAHENAADHVGGMRIRLVQPNVSQSDKWRSENARAMFTELLDLSQQPAVARPDIIVWPEASLPFLIDESSEALRMIGDMLQPGEVLLAGAIRREPGDLTSQGTAGPDRYFTSILKIDDTGKVVDHYDKWRLVPGGEFLPLAWLLEPLGFRKVVNVPESFSPGAGPQVFDMGKAGKAGLLICYEAIFPDHVLPRGQAASFIVNVTNDGWFGQSAGPYQHLAQVQMRAIEQGLPVVRAANSGISAVIDGNGRILASLPLGQKGVVDASLPQNIGPTPYQKAGLAASLGFILLLTAISSFVFRIVRRFS